MDFFSRNKKKKCYLDDFSDAELQDWINGKENKDIDKIIDSYDEYLANKLMDDKSAFVGFKKRDYQTFKMLSSDELFDEVKIYLETEIKSPKYKEHMIATLENDAIRLTKQNIFNEYYSLFENARKLEKEKMHEEALKIYVDILNKYIPEGSDYYKRPCIILEKLKRYDEAIELCNLAISRIEKYNLNFSKDDFYKRLDRLNSKQRR